MDLAVATKSSEELLEGTGDLPGLVDITVNMMNGSTKSLRLSLSSTGTDVKKELALDHGMVSYNVLVCGTTVLEDDATLAVITDSTSARLELQLVRTPGKHIFVIGGERDGQTLDTVERLSVDGENWELMPPMVRPRYGHASAVVRGSLYVLGGSDGTQQGLPLANVERLDLETQSWEEVSDMSTGRYLLAATSIDDVLYVVGGRGPNGHLASGERFDETDTWQSLPLLDEPRFCCAMVAVRGAVYILGGISDDFSDLDSVAKLVPTIGFWDSRVPPMPRPRSAFAAVVVRDVFYITGGRSFWEPLGTVDRFDVASSVWETLTANHTPRYFHGAAALGDTIFLLGGNEDVNEIFDIKTGSWATLPASWQPRSSCTAVVL